MHWINDSFGASCPAFLYGGKPATSFFTQLPKQLTSNLCRFCNVRQSVKLILLECSFRNLERKREVFFENYKKYTGDFLFLSEDAKLWELLNVKPKCKTEDKAKAIEAISNYIRSIYFVIDKEVNVWFGADTNVT